MTWRETTRRARRIADALPLTWRGVLVVALASLAVSLLGYRSLDLVAFAIGAGGFGLVLLCVLAVGSAAFHLWRLQPPPTRASTLARLEAGSPIQTGFSLPALARVPLVQVSWSWLTPEQVECRIRRSGERLEEEIIGRRRRQTSRLRRRISVGDAFGLSRISWEREEPLPVTILPEVRNLRRMPVLQSFAGADGLSHPDGAPEGDRIDIRRYAPGDSVRDILWKAFARTRQLNVRMRERSIERSRRTIAYLVAGPGDEAAAAAARVALESDALGGAWVFGADGTKGAIEELELALRAIARSGDPEAQEDGGAGLAPFLHEVSEGRPESCVVFAPAQPGPWTRGVLAAARAHAGSVSFVIGTDGIAAPGPAAPLWRRVLYADPAPSETSSEDLQQVLAAIGAAGSRAIVVDRSTGRSFAHELQGFARMTG